ncbi:MAG TPA: DUF6481 family protein [Rhizomicrobium sp.]|nr:DUF6481 family protein [Rhizomicrobium sp.]
MNVLQEQKRRGHARLLHILCKGHGISGLENRTGWHRFRALPVGITEFGMRGFREKGFNDRLADQQKARQALLDRARKADPRNDPEFAKRQEERKRLAEEREARGAAKAEARAAAIRAEEERRTAEEAARSEAERIAKEEAEKAKRAEADKLVQLLAEQKAARDARYQARKDRQKKKR